MRRRRRRAKQAAIRWEYKSLATATLYLEIVDDAFSVEVIVSDRKEVPVQGLAPGIFLSR